MVSAYFIIGGDVCVKLEYIPRYTGTVNATLDGLKCQRWNSQSPHKHHYIDPSLFPATSLEDVANYCRTPDGTSWPWCFTTSPGVRSQACDFDVRLCGGGIISGK